MKKKSSVKKPAAPAPAPVSADKAKNAADFYAAWRELQNKFIAESQELAKGHGIEIQVIVQVGVDPKSLI